MKHIIFSFLLFLFSFSAPAQNAAWLPQMLRYVPADSVRTWSYLGADFQQLAWQCHAGETARFLFSDDLYYEQRDMIARMWKMFQPQLNIVGGGDDELRDEQLTPAVAAMTAAIPLWQLTGQAVYADFMERAIFNAALRVAYTPAANRRAGEGALASQILKSVPQLIYGTSADERDLYVNLYTNATATLRLQGERFLFDQITRMPATGQVRFRLSQLKKPLFLRIHLRMPDWAVRRYALGTPYIYVGTPPALPTVFVNGHEVETVQPNAWGYLVVEREWQRGDEIFINFPLTPQYVRRANAATGQPLRGQLAIQSGPQVYVVTTSVENAYFSVNAPLALADSITNQGNICIGGTAFSLDNVPQDAAAPPLPFAAAPYADAPTGTLWCKELGGE